MKRGDKFKADIPGANIQLIHILHIEPDPVYEQMIMYKYWSKQRRYWIFKIDYLNMINFYQKRYEYRFNEAETTMDNTNASTIGTEEP